MTLCVFFLNDLGFFNLLAGALKGMARFFPIPVESLPIIAAQFGNSLVAFPIAGNLLNQLSAIVGQEQLKPALALNIVDPAVGGVLILFLNS